MSQNEKKDSSKSSFGLALLSFLKSQEPAFCSPPYPKWSDDTLKLIPRSKWASYLSQMSKPDISEEVRFGWFSGPGGQ